MTTQLWAACGYPLAVVCLGAAMLLSQLSMAAEGRTWRITPDGTGDAPTIQEGIDSAASGDTVLLADGTYGGVGNRDIRYHAKAVVVRSESGNRSACKISPNQEWTEDYRGFAFDSGEGTESVLEGVTVSGGGYFYYGVIEGAGIYCSGSSPTIRNVYLEANVGSWGGGMACEDASPVLENVAFVGNIAEGGGGLACWGESAPILRDVEFTRNRAHDANYGGGAMLCLEGSAPTLRRVTFVDNGARWGGGMTCWGVSASLTGCLFVRNEATEGGGGMFCGYQSIASVTGTTFAGNDATSGGAVCSCAATLIFDRVLIAGTIGGAAFYCDQISDLWLECCDLYNNGGGDWVGLIAGQNGMRGNFSGDPRFCAAEYGHFALEDCSPCTPGHHPTGYPFAGVIGACGVGCQCGTATERTTWGAIKAMFR